MGLFLELLLTAFVALVCSFIIAKLVSVAVPSAKEKILDEKKGVEEAKKLDKGLKVVRAKAKTQKRVKFVDDVVVRNIDKFEVSEEPIKGFQLSENMSEKVGILDKSLEVARAVHRGEGERVDKESELMLYGEKLVQERGDGSMVREVKGADTYGEGSKDAGLLDEALDREVGEKKNEEDKIGEYCGVKEDVVVSGLGRLEVEEEMRTEGIGGENGLELINANVGSDQNEDTAAGERVPDHAEFLDRELESEAVEEKIENTAMDVDKISGGEQTNIDVGSGGLKDLVVQEKIKSEGFGGETKVELASDDISIPQNEEGRVASVNEDDVIGTEEFSEKKEGVEDKLRDENIGDSAAVGAAADDDDWEGVERSELEKVFAEAVNYVEYGGKTKDDQLVTLKGDVQMQLYGLHKLAVEGPCHEPQPMALKVSARAKW